MSQIRKLQPDRDLQCYFERPSSIAAMSHASDSAFTISGSWRQAFDWAVVEWNRDNVFEHPSMRNLPDGDLRGIQLSYEETRINCIPLDSTLFPTVDWPYLRVWASDGGQENVYKVPLKDHAVAVGGTYAPAVAQFTLQGTLTVGDYVGLSWLDEQYNHQVNSEDSLGTVVQAIVDAVNTFSSTVRAAGSGATISLSYVGAGQPPSFGSTGSNGNRLGAYGFVSGSKTEEWTPQSQRFVGGLSPVKWLFSIDFKDLRDIANVRIPTGSVRKMRWTYAADFQTGHFARSEFEVRVSNWQVTGSNITHRYAGSGSRRFEDDSSTASYSPGWSLSVGNFSGGTIHDTTTEQAAVTIAYTTGASHLLYLGTRFAYNAATVSVAIDGAASTEYSLKIPGEDTLARMLLAELPAGDHTVSLRHSGQDGEYFFFDFLELAIPATDCPVFPETSNVTLATDWDTDHSIALPAERTAWNIGNLGFRGRINHYVGALWFYELERHNHQYASASVTFSGTPVFSQPIEIAINRVGLPSQSQTTYTHQTLIGDTPQTIAKSFELAINNGSTAIWAASESNTLTIFSRSMGLDGNNITISASPGAGPFQAQVSTPTFTGGANGYWRTDLTAEPRLNRAARDWTKSFLTAAKSFGLDAVVAFSMELQHGDSSVSAGIAQRYPSGNPVLLNTPAVQTNFSPTSLQFWRQVFLDAANLMSQAGFTPFLQFGEVQWWYFPYDGSGLPFHDAYTKGQFLAEYGFPIRTVLDGVADPGQYPQEAVFLPNLIGEFTSQVMSFVRATHSDCRFEVLYPTDVNEGAFNSVINYPSSWNPANLDCLKTESFIYTLGRNLNMSFQSVRFAASKGFPKSQRSHLVGISDARTAWRKEADFAKGEDVESIVLFALDQFCLVGYPISIWPAPSSSRKLG